jgi:DUF1009 family protein
MSPAVATAGDEPPLGIVCGGGTVPVAVAEAVGRRGRRVVLFAVRGWADPAAVAAYPHHWVAIGQLGRFCRLARAEGCRDIVLIGAVVRPAVSQIRLDWGTLRRMPEFIGYYHGGDDRLLTGVSRVLALEGFRVVGAHEVAPSITAPLGALGRHRSSAEDETDIELGLALLAATSPFDIGQSVVVARGHVLALEAAEGTDAMLERVAALREAGRVRQPRGTGVLVKAPKLRQDRRFDLPSIGPDTATRLACAGLAGISVIAGATIVAEPQKLIETADREGLFVVGRPDPAASSCGGVT